MDCGIGVKFCSSFPGILLGSGGFPVAAVFRREVVYLALGDDVLRFVVVTDQCVSRTEGDPAFSVDSFPLRVVVERLRIVASSRFLFDAPAIPLPSW
jgi:hypothetical protein